MKQPRFSWWLLASLYVWIHLTLFFIHIVREGYIILGRLDLVVLAVALAQLALIPFIVTTRSRAVGYFFVSTVILLLFVTANYVAATRAPQPLLANYPWPPMRRIRSAKPTLVGIQGPIQFTINRHGLRGPEITSASPKRKILCLGGSATECLYVTDERSWPWRLGSLLSENLPTPFYVGNAGRSGQTALHHAHLVRHYAGIDLFEAVVILCGVNDLGMMLHQNRAERVLQVANEALFERARPHDPYYRPFALWRLLESLLDIGTPIADGQVVQDAAGLWIDEHRAARREKLARNELHLAPATLDAGRALYRQDLLDLIAACHEKKLKVLLVTQPTMWRKDLPEELDRLLWEQTETGAFAASVLADAMAAYNQIMIDVAHATNTPLVDLAALLPQDTTIFYDDCHFNDSGCNAVANQLTKPLTDLLQATDSTPAPPP